VQALYHWMSEQFALRDIAITAFYYCPFHANGTVPEYRRDSDWRNPNPGMISNAAAQYNINLSESLMVGDRISDRIEFAGLRSIIIKSQHTTEEYDVTSIREVMSFL
jgi:histidinol phosphatase-like enzyme